MSALFCRLALKGPAKCRFLMTLLPLLVQAGALDTKAAVMAASVCAEFDGTHCRVYGGLGLHLRPVWRQGRRYGRVSLSCRPIGQESRGYGSISLRRCLVRDLGGCNRGIGLGNAISITRQAQRKGCAGCWFPGASCR